MSTAFNNVVQGQLLWRPSPDLIQHARLTHYLDWLRHERGLRFADYPGLWQWSVDDPQAFWQSIWDHFQVQASSPHQTVLGDRAMPGAQWFPGARLNFAEHILRNEQAGDALLYGSETKGLQGLPWAEFANQVRTLATYLREVGVVPGDRVVAYLPNIPEAMIALCACAAIGAVWASCSPDFGADGVLDRVHQLSPKVLLAVDGYRYGGKVFDRREQVRRIAYELESIEHIIVLSAMFPETPLTLANAIDWHALHLRPTMPAAHFHCEQLPFEHPLWVLFSSGTTGLPKAIVHSHGGMLLEQLKALHLHLDFRPGDAAFIFTTTGWMMWNTLFSSLLCGVRPVLYDGHPTWPNIDTLWQILQDSRASFFGTSPTFIELMKRQEIVPRERFDLGALRTVMPVGSPVSPQCNAWFYQNLKADIWVTTGSGGTDICTGLLSGVPTLPVYAGEIQARALGVNAHAFDEHGQPVMDQVGELVVTSPMPSMPVYFWNDPQGERYRESYFQPWPGVWRHGDFFQLNTRGGCRVLGRSDATLNRFGVRVGTAEIYRALEAIADIDDALIVNLDLPEGGFFMPLFVQLRPGTVLDEAMQQRVFDCLRRACTPRHVPDQILAVPLIPLTLTGKKMEVPVRRILMGHDPQTVTNPSAMRDPQALAFFIEYARRRFQP
ncbi:acetoacetate--CoA ligase [Pseudomonas poae]|uniref:Acetoacetate--CoA ligase n=1 Tax=Pseudomonas poae TaxID=200451 RepID=A0A2S9EFT6_9PSED|nr:acetoacetate--CoA ligase [Pseudomonas poae]PRA24817.1 acetoacetate--CoA ligase [Pseudomonas poae]PRC13962.1 acetoacetate--CoA ligase [Pseudomonas poae]